MAKKLQAKKINEALKRAQRVGEVELPVTIAGCDIVLRSLRPEEYETVVNSMEDLEGIEAVDAYKRGHLSYSLCEINKESLREYDFVEVDIEESQADGSMKTKTVSLEKHQFVSDFIFSTWSREAIDTAFRKFNEVISKSEKAATDGIEFMIPDESAEEKFRRLLTEAREVEGQLPLELIDRILSDIGYTPKASKSELEAIDQKLSQVADSAPTEEAPPPPVMPPQRVAPPPQPQTPVAPPPRAPEAPVMHPRDIALQDPATFARNRVPLNQVAVAIPAPPVSAPVLAPQPPPEMLAQPTIPISAQALRKAQEIERLEGPVGTPPPSIQGGTRFTDGVPELSQRTARVNPQEAERIFDQPPTAGINPRFRPPPRP